MSVSQLLSTERSEDGKFSEPFEVANRVKQGCVMAPTLFSMMFSAMFMDAFQDSDTGFPIRCRFDGNIFNHRRLQPKTKVQTGVLDELCCGSNCFVFWSRIFVLFEPYVRFHILVQFS